MRHTRFRSEIEPHPFEKKPNEIIRKKFTTGTHEDQKMGANVEKAAITTQTQSLPETSALIASEMASSHWII